MRLIKNTIEREMDSSLNYLELLPDEMLLKVLLETDDLKTLSKWCQTSKRVNQICLDEGFWHNKYRKDYYETKLMEGETWKMRYKRRALFGINSPISAGDDHYGIIDRVGNLYMVGDNDKGQLGIGKNIRKSKIPILVKFPQKSQKVISISTGSGSTGAVTKDGKVYIWGVNDRKFSHKNIWLPKELTFPEKAVKIVVEDKSYIVLLEDSSVYFYVNNSIFGIIKGHLQLDVVDISLNTGGAFTAVTKDHKLYMWGNLSEYGINRDYDEEPIHIPLPEPVVKVSQRDYFAIVLSTTGNIYSLGFDTSGDTDTPDGIKNPILIKLPEIIIQIEGYYETFAALSNTGRLYMWGDNAECKISNDRESEKHSILSEISFGFPINFVSIGSVFTIAVSNDGVVNYWGAGL